MPCTIWGYGDDGVMVEITSREELKEWLKDKPFEWGQAIAIRAGLRTLPIALNDFQISETWQNIESWQYICGLWRANFVPWAVCNIPTGDISNSSLSAANSDAGAASSISKNTISADAFRSASYNPIAVEARRSIDSDAKNYADTAIMEAIDHSVRAISFFNSSNSSNSSTWRVIELDAKYLRNSVTETPSIALTANPLWSRGTMPAQIGELWSRLKNQSYPKFWNNYCLIYWYELKLLGHTTSFRIKHDKNRIEDKTLTIKIANQGDDFWLKGPNHVNAELNKWLDEARERAQELYKQEQRDENIIDEDNIEIPAQNTNAITFKRNTDGKITIDSRASIDEIKKDNESQELHQLAIEEALEIKQKCAGNNAAARLTQLLDNYLNSIGESLDEIKPSMAVQRGEKLRQEILAYDKADNMLPPISDEMLLDLKAWETSHNMMVAFQPKLNDLDRAILGPDRQPAPFTPSDLNTLTSDAEDLELLKEGTREILEETAFLAPVEFDPNNRRSLWTSVTTMNFIKETAAITLNNPSKLLTVAAIGKSAWSDPVNAAKLLVEHRHWLEEKFANYPTMQSVIRNICDKFENETPFESKPKDENKP